MNSMIEQKRMPVTEKSSPGRVRTITARSAARRDAVGFPHPIQLINDIRIGLAAPASPAEQISRRAFLMALPRGRHFVENLLEDRFVAA